MKDPQYVEYREAVIAELQKIGFKSISDMYMAGYGVTPKELADLLYRHISLGYRMKIDPKEVADSIREGATKALGRYNPTGRVM